MMKLKRVFENYLAAENGAVAIEYALIAVALVLAIVGRFPNLTAAISNKLQGIATSLTNLT